jgi:Zn-dependent alcohol dehydrogenase
MRAAVYTNLNAPLEVLDLDSMVSRRLELDAVNAGFEALERSEVIRSVIVF